MKKIISIILIFTMILPICFAETAEEIALEQISVNEKIAGLNKTTIKSMDDLYILFDGLLVVIDKTEWTKSNFCYENNNRLTLYYTATNSSNDSIEIEAYGVYFNGWSSSFELDIYVDANRNKKDDIYTYSNYDYTFIKEDDINVVEFKLKCTNKTTGNKEIKDVVLKFRKVNDTIEFIFDEE